MMISREEAIAILSARSRILKNSKKTGKQRAAEALDMAIEALSNERPKGRWNPISADRVRCTNCDAIRDITTQLFWDSCPNCGADMRESENE